MHVLWFWLTLAILMVAGCGRATPGDSWPAWSPTVANTETANNLRSHGLVVADQEDRIEGRGRKLVYHAEADLLVDDLTTAGEELETLLRAHKGILANSEISTYSGAPRAGLWQVRVPTDDFEAFLKEFAGVGEMQRSRREVQDVTRSHSELEEQVKNMTSALKGLRELLKKPADKLADTLAVREQLFKVTRELDGLKARIQRMRSQAEYSTITLRLRERKGLGPDTALAPSIVRAFHDSWQTLLSCGRGTILGLAMLVPWLPVVALVCASAWVVGRRIRRCLVAPIAGA
jgi:hypothetical protein